MRRQRPMGRRRLWPVMLISSSLLLVVVGAVAVGQFYWESLHGGMQRMRASIDEARRRQADLTRELQRSQAVLAARRTELDRREAELDEREQALRAGGGDVEERARDAVEAMLPDAVEPEIGWGPPSVSLTSAERRRLQSMLAGLARSAAGLPPPPARPPRADGRDPARNGRGGPRPGRYGRDARYLIQSQIELAEAALALGDPLLLDVAAAAAQRLLLDLYGEARGRARILDERLGLLRAALRGDAGPAHPR